MPASRARTHAMAYVIAPDRSVARRIARIVLEQRLAACANLAPIESLYWWKGHLEQTREVLIVFKTRRTLVARLAAAVKAAHPYEVPCVVSYAMEGGLPAYLAWIDGETRAQR